MILVFDGPEKAGKSTIIKMLKDRLATVGFPCKVRPWGPVTPDDRVYAEPLQADVQWGGVTIWDRSWAAEHVYGVLMDRERRLRYHPWLGEWLHGRAVQATGLRIMVLPKEVGWLKKRRDETDLPVDPYAEFTRFSNYAMAYGWKILQVGFGEAGLTEATDQVFKWLYEYPVIDFHRIPPNYAGPQNAKVIFVGERPSKALGGKMPGAWLPFCSNLTMKLGDEMGNEAFACGWTNSVSVPPSSLRGAEVIVSCGQIAATWVHSFVLTPGSKITHIQIPHPAWMYRYHNERSLEALERTRACLSNLRLRISSLELAPMSDVF